MQLRRVGEPAVAHGGDLFRLALEVVEHVEAVLAIELLAAASREAVVALDLRPDSWLRYPCQAKAGGNWTAAAWRPDPTAPLGGHLQNLQRTDKIQLQCQSIGTLSHGRDNKSKQFLFAD